MINKNISIPVIGELLMIFFLSINYSFLRNKFLSAIPQKRIFFFSYFLFFFHINLFIVFIVFYIPQIISHKFLLQQVELINAVIISQSKFEYDYG